MTPGATGVGSGVALATFLAGPIATSLLAAMLVVDGRADDLVEILPVLVLSIPVGAVFSFLPNLLGAAALARIGRAHRAARSPLIWAATGCALGALIVRVPPGGVEAVAMWWFAANGGACALICRRSVRWD